MIEYKTKDIYLETSYWQPEVGGAKNTYNYLLKFLVCEYYTDVDLRIEFQYLVDNEIRYLFYELPKDKTRIKIKLPVGINTRAWKVRLYNINEKTINTTIQYIGVLGIPIPIGDRLR